jgi:hypothetical protein
MNHAEPFTMVGKGMMESTSNVEGDVVLQSMISGEN